MGTSISCNEQPRQVDRNYILQPRTPAALLMRPRLKEETVAGLAWFLGTHFLTEALVLSLETK